jgi:hypothetical protein
MCYPVSRGKKEISRPCASDNNVTLKLAKISEVQAENDSLTLTNSLLALILLKFCSTLGIVLANKALDLCVQ